MFPFFIGNVDLHSSGIFSVQLDPRNNNLVLTKGFDGGICIVDSRKAIPIQTFRTPDVTSLHSPCRCVLSPDSRYVASGSGSMLYIWNAVSGSQVEALKAHDTPIVAIDWSLSGKGMHPITTLDRKGTMVYWS